MLKLHVQENRATLRTRQGENLHPKLLLREEAAVPKLHVQENRATLSVGQGDSLKLSAATGIPIYPQTYTGAYSVTPSANVQTLPTSGLMMTDNITVDPIPSNYGLITYNGSTITVS